MFKTIRFAVQSYVNEIQYIKYKVLDFTAVIMVSYVIKYTLPMFVLRPHKI